MNAFTVCNLSHKSFAVVDIAASPAHPFRPQCAKDSANPKECLVVSVSHSITSIERLEDLASTRTVFPGMARGGGRKLMLLIAI